MAKFDEIDVSEQKVIDRFIDHLWMENGLTKNTLSAYRNDLAGFALWLAGDNSARENLSLLSVNTSVVQNFLAHNYKIQQKRRSVCQIVVNIAAFLSIFAS